MPNWCNNDLELTHTDPTMIAKAKQALIDGNFLQTFIPCPEELKSDENQTNAQSDENLKNHGYVSWYDFNVNEWGTKWDVQSYDEPDVSADGLTLSASFDSAWSPPIQAYRKLEELGFDVHCMYYESGMAFCGEFVDGDDDYYDIPDTAEEAADYIPSQIDENFGIVESMRDFEEMQEDEESENE